MFPQYVSAIAEIAEVRLIASTFGVRGLLMAGDRPALLKTGDRA
jgi:hypothetical protein